MRLRSAAWWLHPAWTILLAAVPGLIIAWRTGDETFRAWWRTPKLFDGELALITALLLTAFLIGTLLPMFEPGGGRRLARRTEPGEVTVDFTAERTALLAKAARVFLSLTVIGYLAWAAAAIMGGLRPGHLIAVLQLQPGASDVLKEQLATVPGVTTLTQFGPVAMVCMLLHRRLTGERHTMAMAVLVIAALGRTVLNSERLALLEIVVPVVVLAAVLRPRIVRLAPAAWACAPLAAPVVLAGGFAVFEYVRSWSYYAQELSYTDFIVQRLTGYYATAYNNSVLALDRLEPMLPFPYFTIEAAWRLPLSPGADPEAAWTSVLEMSANPEFNNYGGILPAVADYGIAGALIWWTAVGLAVGLCYRALRLGSPAALTVYPLIYVGLIDVARYFYFGQGRAVPVLAGAVILAVMLRRTR